MIGIIADELEKGAIEEFFQLFKTPWEYYEKNKSYRVVIVTKNESCEAVNAEVLFIFGNRQTQFDENQGIRVNFDSIDGIVRTVDKSLPIYSGLSYFENRPNDRVLLKGDSKIYGIKFIKNRQIIHRLGFNLFAEISFLLTQGQPKENALTPALEILIALLKTWILEGGVPIVEIPAVPEGHDFIVCLTHDVDFINIRDHFIDHTMLGFLSRAIFGSFISFIRGKVPFSRVWRNWKAVFSLPLVLLGWIDDFWFQFDRYMEIEKGATSTFFLIPFKKRPGDKAGSARRAAKYDIMDMRETVKKLIRKGHEIGVHGIDAWHSQEKGNSEWRRINDVTGHDKIGIRMHWLLLNHQTFPILEKAGYYYDSTLGYNDAVGYKTGTSQVFRPLGTKHLLELPLLIQDTTLFYSKRMNLPENQAITFCERLIRNALSYGGVLTINWHQRSLAPERLWGDFYLQLLQRLRLHRPWFATAGQAVDWHQKRRDASFDDVHCQGDELRLVVRASEMAGLPGLLLRIHRPRKKATMNLSIQDLSGSADDYEDIPWKERYDLRMTI